MLLTQADIQQMEHIPRLNLINSITGIKPANLIGTQDSSGMQNLAIFSSVVHLGSNPPLIGFIMRPTGDVPRHTYDNLKSTGVYTINHVTIDKLENAHYTSAKFQKEESEFDQCGLTPELVADFKAPFVKESQVKMGLEFVEQIEIKHNNTLMIIGEIKLLTVPKEALSKENYLNLETAQSAGISGLNSYYSFKHEASFEYARPENNPFHR